MRPRILAAAAVLVATACTTSQQNLSASDSSRTAWPDDSADALRSSATVAAWTAYRTFHFDTSAADVSALDMPKAYEIVAYLKDNPSFDVGIDCTGEFGVDEPTDPYRVSFFLADHTRWEYPWGGTSDLTGYDSHGHPYFYVKDICNGAFYEK